MLSGSFPPVSPAAAATLLLLPLSLLLGGTLFWPAACLAALASALERDHAAMLACYGLALGFDPQAALAAPVFAAVLIQRRVPPAVLTAGAVSAAAMLSVRWMAGGLPAPAFPLDTALSSGAPNLWTIAGALPGIGTLPLIGLAFTATVGAAAACTAWVSARRLADNALLDAALLCNMATAMLAPGGDMRVFVLADILALMLALGTRDAGRWRIAILLLAGSGLALAAPADWLPLAALATLAATLLQARAVLHPAANDNPLMARAF